MDVIDLRKLLGARTICFESPSLLSSSEHTLALYDSLSSRGYE